VRIFKPVFPSLILFACLACSQPAQTQNPDPFIQVLLGTEEEKSLALKEIESNWSEASVPKAIELMRFINDRKTRDVLLDILKESTGKNRFGSDFSEWLDWLWNQEPKYDESYPRFKADLYSLVDYKFYSYFQRLDKNRIRLDEIVWGGVVQDGIPPLRSPKMLEAKGASYLDDDHIVFGIEVNGDARAYPKRILAWHEMFVDEIGGEKVIGVYCTLCGTVILFETEQDDKNYEMGTSGFLYRSNKLMYDKGTSSLWNTFWGEPVVGELADSGVRLERGSVVNTSWGEWKKRHPDTKVLSLETGHQRNYNEGEAYRNYFATDDLMFGVPKVDKRLKNKDEVFTLLEGDSLQVALAIHTKFLKKNPVYHTGFNNRSIVVLTDKSGANRAYESHDVRFEDWDRTKPVMASEGRSWTLTESALSLGDERFERISGQVAFWFGWFAANPSTQLIK